MRDIEKMKAEFDQKIEWAKLENEHDARLLDDRLEIVIVGRSLTQQGKLHAYFSCIDPRVRPSDKLSYRQLGGMLCRYPVTEELRVYTGAHRYDMMRYSLQTHRYPNEPWTTLKVEWISGILDLKAEVYLDGSDEGVNQFFQKRHRRLEDSELSSFGIQKTRFNKDKRESFPYLGFAAGTQTRFQGGYILCTSNAMVTSVTERLKYMYEFENE